MLQLEDTGLIIILKGGMVSISPFEIFVQASWMPTQRLPLRKGCIRMNSSLGAWAEAYIRAQRFCMIKKE